MNAETVVGTLLENEQVKKWDNVVNSARKLYGLKRKSLDLFRQMSLAYTYERELARLGVKKEDVAQQLRGNHIGATDNYKKTMPMKRCTNEYCGQARAGERGLFQPNKTACSQCGQALQDTTMRIQPSMLRDKLADHVVGVKTNDGRTLFFDQPLHPAPWKEWEHDEVKVD